MPARLIIAHDDPEFIESIVMALRGAGYDVLAFARSMAALDVTGGRAICRSPDYARAVS